MVFENLTTNEFVQSSFVGAMTGLAVFIILLICLIAIAGLYIYHALALKRIAEKRGHKKPWLAWIPFANVALILELGKFHWALVFLLAIPVFGWIAMLALVTISFWRVFEQLGFKGWFSLSLPLSCLPSVGGVFGILYLVTIGLVAWNKKGSSKKKSTKRTIRKTAKKVTKKKK